MNFSDRFFLFFFGIILGILVVLISLQFRTNPISFNYFPSDRIKHYFISNEINITDIAKCYFNCLDLDTLMLSNYILESKIIYAKSKIRGFKCKKYNLYNHDFMIDFIFTNCDTILSLEKLNHLRDTICNCS